MTRYLQLVVLLLSFLLPLQVVAEALFTASSCSQMMSTQAKPMAKASTMAKTSSMNCCGEAAKSTQEKESTANPCIDQPHSDGPQKTSSCQNAYSCSLCKTPTQFNLFGSIFIEAHANLSQLHLAPYTHIVTLNPASIWRPPCLS